MTDHLTERDLIEFEFGLGSDEQGRIVSAHLEECADCRGLLEQLRGRFASLDLLREDAEVSEGLISSVLEDVRKPVRSRGISWHVPAWIGSAAAVLVMATLLLVSDMNQRPMKPSTPVAPTGGDESGISLDDPAKLSGALVREHQVKDDAITEKPPFAPASAIELVVLPRRENIQLTIYNSTFQTGPIPMPINVRQAKVQGYSTGQYEVAQSERWTPESRNVRTMPGGDLTLVRETRKLTLKKGWNWLQFMWANTKIDPTSLNLEPLEQKDKIKVEELVFPARLRELGRWLIRSEVSGQAAFEITYFTTGLTWRAFYMGTLSADERKMHLGGYVRISNNSGEDYENAETRLIVGNVHILDKIADLAARQYAHGRPGGPVEFEDGGGAQWGMMRDELHVDMGSSYGGGLSLGAYRLGDMKPKEIVKEGLSEYFLYAIEGTETIPNQWAKRLRSFEQDDIEIESLYKYDEERYGRQTTRFIIFSNDEEHNLGQTPLPDGSIKIYGIADSNGYLSYVGGTGVKYIPVGEEVELNLGAARLVTVEPKLMNFETTNYVFGKDKNISGWDEIRTWKVEITNTRTLPIEVDIMRGFAVNYWSLVSDIDYEEHDINHVRFTMKVSPRTKKVFNYTVTMYHGQRQIDINQ